MKLKGILLIAGAMSCFPLAGYAECFGRTEFLITNNTGSKIICTPSCTGSHDDGGGCSQSVTIDNNQKSSGAQLYFCVSRGHANGAGGQVDGTVKCVDAQTQQTTLGSVSFSYVNQAHHDINTDFTFSINSNATYTGNWAEKSGADIHYVDVSKGDGDSKSYATITNTLKASTSQAKKAK